jgi:hypothetical protein
MTSRVVVVLYILLCLTVGILLSVLPWLGQGQLGFGDWGNNFFLVWLVHKTGFYGLQHFIASGWVRGAVTGLGMLNLFNAFWEIVHFNQAVKVVDSEVSQKPVKPFSNEPSPVDLSDNRRVDEQ